MNIKTQEIILGDICIDVTKKNVRYLHLKIYPPDGKVKISAPYSMSYDAIKAFAVSRIPWINMKQEVFKKRHREPPKEFVTDEKHYFFGESYLLKIFFKKGYSKVILNNNVIELYTNSDSDKEKRKKTLYNWYRKELNLIAAEFITKWEKAMNVSINEFGIKLMKTKWGTCNIKAKRIWLNLELAKRPLQSLEYIIVHDLTHLLERKHNARFKTIMSQFLPMWKEHKKELNSLPLTDSN